MNNHWSDQILNSFQTLSKLDNNYKYIISKYGLPNCRKEENNFKSLMKIIIGQQISRKAADSIFERLLKNKISTHIKFLKYDDLFLKNFGLSFRKIQYLKNLAKKIDQNEINLIEFENSSSEFVYNSLIKIKGIGKWTINNYQLFVLEDCDAWPGGDLAIQEAIKKLNKLDRRPTENDVNILAKKWMPFRGSAALLLWHYYSRQ